MTHEDLSLAMQRVRQMEALFDRLSAALRESPALLPADEELRQAAQSLSDYQSGGDWLRDYKLEEQGLLPAGLKRGVLSEDGLYALLCSPELEALLDGGAPAGQTQDPDRGPDAVTRDSEGSV